MRSSPSVKSSNVLQNAFGISDGSIQSIPAFSVSPNTGKTTEMASAGSPDQISEWYFVVDLGRISIVGREMPLTNRMLIGAKIFSA